MMIVAINHYTRNIIELINKNLYFVIQLLILLSKVVQKNNQCENNRQDKSYSGYKIIVHIIKPQC